MNLVVTLEYRFDRTPDGVVWTHTAYAHPFWLRYLAAFDAVYVVARIRDVPHILGNPNRADGGRVHFVGIPYYLGPGQYMLKARQVARVVRNAVTPSDAVILRVPSQIANALVPQLHKRNHPYGIEVVGDPYDVFAPGAVSHPLRPFLRWWFPRQLQRQCVGACAVAYVTEQALQRRYPPAQGASATHYSDVELPESAFVSSHRQFRPGARSFVIITVATLAQLYKAPDVLIDAVAACVRDGLDLHLALVGDGKYRPEMEARVMALGLGKRVHFLGQLPAGDAVRAELDRADVFVLPSRTDALPRAMIEAMARGLPCIGSTIGGVPELLSPEDLVPPGDVSALANKMGEVVRDPERMMCMSKRNLEKAREYREETLRDRRAAFYDYVRDRTEDWLRGARTR